MLTQYKNIKQINSASGSISAERLSKNKTEFVSFDADETVYYNVDILNRTNDSRLELHVYSNETWITGNHKVQVESKLPEYRNKTTNRVINWVVEPVAINIYNELNNLKLNSGTFRIVVNFFKNLIGSYELPQLRIEEISTDRTEVKLRAIDENNPEFLTQITNFIQQVSTKQTSSKTKFYKSYLLNFSRNKCFSFVNSVVIGEYVYVKLLDPLPNDIAADFKCWIVEEQKDPYIDSVSISKQLITKKFNRLANPNWQAADSTGLSSETDFKTWTELLGSSAQTSQQIVDSYFSGSLSGIELNIDHSDFNNFIFYSSATERLQNFKYKLQLLEYYSSQSFAVSQISGSIALLNSAEYNSYKTNLISGFDNFEKYLYFQSESKFTTYPIPVENSTVSSLTGSYILPAPKSTSTYPYQLYSVTSSQFTAWYSGLIDSASYYDSFNLNSLEYALPEYIRFDSTQQQAVTFTRMLGQHYDILYSYIKHVSQIYKREENPKLGMPNELLYSVAKQFGWTLSDGNQQQELWSYLLGTNESGAPLTGSNSINGTSMPAKDRTYAIWRRIVNNLPFLLKTKGTKRSVQALLACYGIPQSIISINEYGGPRLERAPVYEKLNFDYALDLIGNISGSVLVNYSQSLGAVELRFRTDEILSNPLLPNTMNLYTIGSNTVTIDFTSGTKGNVQINGTGSSNFEIYNGDWISTLLRTSGSNLELVVKKSKYGKIVTTVTASAIGSFDLSGSIELGGNISGSRLVGQLQELRLWSSSLQDSPFNNHTKAPSAYDGNVDAYSELIFRLPLTQKIDHSLTGSLTGVQPVSSSISASFINWSNSEPYDSIEETYYYDAISLGAGTFDDNKIRIESSELIGPLDVKTRAERSQYDKAPLDSKKIGVYFSPQTMIDEDIIAQLGYTNLDEYIGDPGAVEDKSYPELERVAQNYWKKYEDKNDINAYIKIFTLFDLSFFKQLNQVLPARVDKTTGILIQPNILERSKDTILPTIKRFNPTYEAELDQQNPVTTGEKLDYSTIIDDTKPELNGVDLHYSTIIDDTRPELNGSSLQYFGFIDDEIYTISGQDDDQWQMYLTASDADRYDGVIYSHDYLILSGSEYITGSTPYWISEPLCPAITSSTTSEFKQQLVDGVGSLTPVTVATTSRLGSTYNYSNTLFINAPSLTTIIDGVSIQLNNKILVKNGSRQDAPSTGSSNGIYVYSSTTGANGTGIYLTRIGTLKDVVVVRSGSINANKYFIQTVSNPVTSSLLFDTDPRIPTYESTSMYRQYNFAEVSDFLPQGIENQRYSGTKMKSPAFNVNSTQTYDGGPVVEWRAANPNQLIYQRPGEQGSFRIT